MDVIKIRTHKELSDVAEKYWGFTFRQWIFLALTAVIVVPLYIYTKPIIGDELASWIVISLITTKAINSYSSTKAKRAATHMQTWKSTIPSAKRCSRGHSTI